MSTLSPLASSTSTGPVVRTREGLYEGVDRGGSVAFLGMPFAAPPVGELRFQAPAPAAAFDGVRRAVEFGATPQRRNWGPDALVPEYVVPGESTLNVNVFTPAPGDEAALLPVYVWIHGGGYFSGSPACPWYDGAAFNRDGVVTVSISYRLAFDGFGWIQDAPLNRGVLDQIAALEWVAANIRAFGGDPANVTIGGQSAGGGSVMTLLAAPAARGLFHRVIAHSPAVSHATPADAEVLARRFAADFGVTPDRAGWTSVPESEIVAQERQINRIPGSDDLASGALASGVAGALAAARRNRVTSLDLVFAPIQDGVIVEDLAQVLAGPALDGIDLLIGSTRDEFVGPDDEGGEGVSAVLAEQGLDGESFSGFREELGRIGERHGMSLLLTSQMFRSPISIMTDLRRGAGCGARTWLFSFDYHSAVTGLAVHGYDLPFAFDVLHAEGVEPALGAEPPQRLADSVHGAWVRFIATGDPGWASVDAAPLGAMSFDEPAPRFDEEAYASDAAIAAVPGEETALSASARG